MQEKWLPPHSNLVRRSFLSSFLLVVLFGILSLFPTSTWAAQPTPDAQVGDIVTDPETGADVTVTGLLQGDDGYAYGVTTDTGRRIYTTTDVDDIFPSDDGDWTVTAADPDADSGYIEEITMQRPEIDVDGNPVTDDDGNAVYEEQTLIVAVDYDASNPVDNNGDPIDPSGSPGDPETEIPPPPPAAGDSNYISKVRKGASGDDGRDGYGVEVCIPYTDICETVAYSPESGDDGSTPSALTLNVSSSHGDITTVSSKRAGITAIRTGGDGGTGGDAYGNIDAENGGAAGAGGSVTVTANVTISTSGYKGHGIFAKSNAGKAGDGGSGILWSNGGFSGDSAHGGTVRVTNETDGLIGTTGNYAYGILAQSLGGAAGSGGDSWGLVGDGGSSGTAGNGGSVYVTHKGNIVTDGRGSHAIFAQSIGGLGGDGGSGVGISGLGGDGSVGGNGGSVSVTTTPGSQIETKDKASHGILAQSIGGGGGNGGVGAGIVGLGGGGSGGGNGSSVNVTHNGSILTLAKGSYGILAQSIGGGGGNAGVGAGIVALGSTGSGGGNGGAVTVNTGSAGSITTLGDYSHAMLAQSIGGGGGTGGTGGGVVTIGGSGGAGGNGSSVSVDSAATIETQGDYARAIFAQSIGGGGGDGGAGGGIVSIGGSGSGGGNGGTVDITNSGQIETWDFASDAIFAQSIGGGGGSGGGSGGLVSIGGDGNSGSYGNTVTVNNYGSITTHAGFADAIFAQSIGGGGGSGAGSGGGVSLGGSGSGGGNGGEVNVTNTGVITTWGVGEAITTWNGVDITALGNNSSGIFAQSVGGGGGSGAGSGGIVSLGGNAGAASHGGIVGVNNSGNITTWSGDSSAIFAQSIGGGGGYGMGGGGSGGIVSLGGDAGAGGDGNTVHVTQNNAALQTAGDYSKGIFAQSVGGGGGFGGGSGGAVSLGGDGGSGGDGGTIIVNDTDGSIATAGKYADAIYAQSVGGGGGEGGGSGGAVSLGGGGGAGGAADDVSVTSSSRLDTFGDYSEGIYAQSVGGGGGSGAGSGGVVSLGGRGESGGQAGEVTVTHRGIISTHGISAEGIYAQSVGGGGGDGAGSGGTVSIGGSGSGAGDAETVTVVQGNGQSNGSVSTQGDYSEAIFAQSVGGGGGDGAGSGGTISIGGSGSGGATGGEVQVTNFDSLTTAGKEASGIYAQSVGGGGGNGAASGGLISFGGSGSGAAAADSVSVTNSGTISTAGSLSDAIFAQSVGGGGGNGGTTGGVFLTMGGHGASGGNAGSVTANSNHNLTTLGDDADGIFAQSLGGGGGNAGSAASGAAFAGLAIGADGGGGGDADSAMVTTETYSVNGDDYLSLISTVGDRSRGIFAESVGGGGGNGGFAVQGSAGTFFSLSIAVGGSGGLGGDGDEVTVNAAAVIETAGEDADGLVAQSTGGGGGNGGFSVAGSIQFNPVGGGAVAVGVGGSGGSGGNADVVDVDFTGAITTGGDLSEGLLAQSVGGGGGNGGFDVATSISGGGVGSGAINVGVGGSGGDGGDGGSVESTVRANISTAGDKADALIAQSVGGGGGNGGFNVSSSISVGGGGSGAVNVGVGGSGGGGGNGSAVDLDAQGNLNTSGDDSDGLLAQSVGGGGGNGAFNVSATINGSGAAGGAIGVGVGGSGDIGGDGDIVSGHFSGGISTQGKDSDGAVIQSVGGGGGNGGFNVSGTLAVAGGANGALSVGIGGAGAGGGNGGEVSTTIDADISTRGNQSEGIIIQSAGGGGGNGGFNVTGTVAGAAAANGGVAVGVGGAGGSGGDSDTVNATVNGTVSTAGEKAAGVTIQSVGGGGGNGGFDIAGTISLSGGATGAVAVGVGGSGGAGGDGDAVTATVNADIETEGKESAGLLAQSVGGGGGSGNFNISGAIGASTAGTGAVAVGVGGSGGGGGDGREVNLTVTDSAITSLGKKSTAIMAQSVGGGGGDGGFDITGAVSLTSDAGGNIGVGIGGFGGDGGNAGTVVAATSGSVQTTGDESMGIVAQSTGGGGGNGAVNVTGDLSVALGGVSAAVGIGVGGFGGGGGTADDVNLTSATDVTTDGANAHGVMAQSVGGGGGNGGVNVSGALSAASTGASFGVAAGVGGFGGDGGDAGEVTASVSDNVLATGLGFEGDKEDPDSGESYWAMEDGSHGIVAQSLGGGGGNGGVNVSGGIGASVADIGASGSVTLGVGGFGGGGGSAAAVTLDVENQETRAIGDDRTAVLAQSLGGGGGNGGVNVSGGISTDGALTVGVGGFGGDGGSAGNVSLTANSDVVDAAGARGVGVMAQSVGGGGGNGGVNVSGSVTLSKKSTLPSLTVGVGGFGGDGDVSGDVSVDHSGSIATDGEWGHGLLAQSIAGGGGNGGFNFSGSLNVTPVSASVIGGAVATIGVGGSGGSGNDAGSVTVSSSGAITTSGDEARGVFAQSVGGGGGTGGTNVDLNLNMTVFGSGTPIVVGVGGSGGSAGDAGDVAVARGTEDSPSDKIETDGTGSIGLEASSIGGGGGDAGMNLMLAVSNETSQSDSYAIEVGIGGGGGESGDGAQTTVVNFGDINTVGTQSHGLLAQSIGGGGGNANLNVGFGWLPSNKIAKLTVGGATGDGGEGGDVSVQHHGDISSDGENAAGIIAQSIGGGGGNAGLDTIFNKGDGGGVALSLGRHGGTGGSGGTVDLFSSGELSTTGSNGYGLLAQSIGGGGGNSSAVGGGVTSSSFHSSGQSAAVSVGLTGGVGGEGGNVTLSAEGMVTTSGEKAHALFAQSVGGGGGNGGNANTAGITAPAAGVSVGGEGGVGGVGGTVILDNSAAVQTTGEKAVAVFAQSVGGGGGTGGAAYSGGIKSSGSGVQVTVGGSGGSGVDGGEISVDNSGVLSTSGERSHGVLAQSIGGGGGDGGLVVNGLINTNDADTARLFVSVGGDGGTGGIGNLVDVVNDGGIFTTGAEAVGVLAQSIGGGGGTGSTVITGSLSKSGGGLTLGLGIGGSGGSGATGGDVTVSNLVQENQENSGEIHTSGDGAHGIMGLSIGGGGGTGSTVITGTVAAGSDSASSALALSLGGDGGDGGTAGTVTVENAGHIVTNGDEAHGIVAESIGGGGGNGGMSIAGNLLIGELETSGINSAVSVGGSGGSGNTGNDVLVDNSGAIETFGDKSYGIFAQSVGGGGGNGGVAVAASIDPSITTGFVSPSTVLSIGVGGSAGDGALGGDVTVNHSGSIITNGDDTYGIFAQSVGGGGGTSALSFSSPFWMAVDDLSALLGAKDGSAAIGGDVTVNSSGTIITHGANSSAVFTQAISSGGGGMNLYLDLSQDASSLDQEIVDIDEVNSVTENMVNSFKEKIGLGGDGNRDNAGGTVESSHVGDILATGDYSSGLEVQSIGGGGGTSLSEMVVRPEDEVDLELTLGATGSTNVGGGDIHVERSGQVATLGVQSKGVSVQSIGGGGGSLNQVLTRSSDVVPTGAATVTGQIGADGGIAHDSGDVALEMTGDLSTAGERSQGIFVQSIGAGGGELRLTGFDSADLSLGGKNGATGDGGAINLMNTGLVSTEGELSHGVMLQSIGGGGGAVFSDLEGTAVDLSLSSGGSGNAGNITLTQNGVIQTSGDRAYGVFVQSVGGGGGAVDTLFAGSSGGSGGGGNISLTLADNVISSGRDATAIFAQSVGGVGSANGAINLELNGDFVIAGSGDSIGVHIDGGADNRLINRAALMTLEGVAGEALRGGDGGEQVDNYGTVIGNIDLGGGSNSFFNHDESQLLSGATALLGSGNLLTNAGQLSPGDLDTLQTTVLSGNFLQTGIGTFLVDLDFNGNVADQIDAAGWAQVSGTIDLNPLNQGWLLPGYHEVVVVHGDLGVSDTATELLADPSAVVAYQLHLVDEQDLAVALNIDFAPDELTGNLALIGDFFNRIQLAGGAEAMAPVVTDIFNLADVSELAETYSYMNPDDYDYFTEVGLGITRQFNSILLQRQQSQHLAVTFATGPQSSSDSTLSEKRIQLAYNGSDAGMLQLLHHKDRQLLDSGLWLNYSDRRGNRDAGSNYADYEQKTHLLAMGYDSMINPRTLVGFSLGYSRTGVEIDEDTSDGDIDTYQTALYVSHHAAPFHVNGIFSYARQEYDNTRLARVMGEYRLATSEHQGNAWSLYGEIERDLKSKNWLLQPNLGLNYIYLTESGFTESGADVLNLRVKRRSTQTLTADLGVKLSGLFAMGSGFIGPEMSVDLNHDFAIDDRTVTAGFAGYPGAVFTVLGRDVEKDGMTLGCGVNYLSKNGFNAFLKYREELRPGMRTSEVMGEIRIKF